MTQQHNFLHWYETSLPTNERKTRGHFSTPSLLVEQILDACGYTPDRNLSRIRILDPACGSGNFLTGAARRLIQSGQRTEQNERAIARQLQRNLWGFDPDPIACFLADIQLRSHYSESQLPARLLQNFHIHQADGLAFPWTAEAGIDLFLANPPYLAAKNTDLSCYRSTHQRGQTDSYLLFLNLALQIVKPGGWIALVLPDPVLARANAAHERQRLLKETTVHHLWHLSDVFNAYVGAVVLIAQKSLPPIQHVITWKRERWHRRPQTSANATNADTIQQKSLPQHVSQALLQQQPGAELRYLLSTVDGTLIARLHQFHTGGGSSKSDSQSKELVQRRPIASLGDVVAIRRGEELGKDSQLLQARPPQGEEQDWYPLLRGGIDIRPHCYPSASRWISTQHIVKPLQRYTQPKLLLVKSVGTLQATIDLKGHVVLQTLYILQLHRQHTEPSKAEQPGHFSIEDELYFLLALLNSRLLQDYMYVLYTAYKLVQPQIEQHVLAALPIPLSVKQSEKERIIDRTRDMMDACSSEAGVVELQTQSHALYEEQERSICALYEQALYEASTLSATQQSLSSPSAIDKGVLVWPKRKRAAPSAY
ncbi:N-6 DNA methylase [Ktedonobacteria bacterium brp13]|nr:N-6 DNA methylase [Ktedonobacteria bacterium brp13]